MNQHQLPLITDFEQATAHQLALERNRATPTEQDMADAVKLAANWNKQRQKAGLKPWV